MGYLFIHEQDLPFHISSGIVTIPAGMDGVVLSHQVTGGRRARILRIACEPEASSDWPTTEFYIAVNGIRTPIISSIRAPHYPLGNAKEIFLDVPNNGLIEIRCINSAVSPRGFRASLEGWEYSVV